MPIIDAGDNRDISRLWCDVSSDYRNDRLLLCVEEEIQKVWQKTGIFHKHLYNNSYY